ncbi:MAG: restriction endonuclease [Candidatus Andersenbacteria bacterium RIFCSPHIGHO2_02_FULL_45_11]|uniref:Restriction endonuclease n=1 Tax=Candidatus Andersenbacteria bacterium RIFCSPHIGHO2_12_FULL_45_11 TaxID=1797281 RepID=A0A1G1X2W6_9BACT|nr:MAG: restriction endonuclease [Candidatus Andersenbacteria bacterium RIFCSPHIGHO2_01_FULL_46_36]OGY34355.1 MAG: restriction endonuclease [Candidatus Andersenbacteria bacterium RIFCSPHIGHO2_12_FULL_45_11]OGY34934.1 MAG: restriction endonuclease [Candidatus Andersenbacteria bacterium RIFCSPHIGHO2_02_FULL_45_11]
MDLFFDKKIAEEYTSQSQKIRVLTEDWVNKQIYCPNCGKSDLGKYENNKPVADFFCKNCNEDYELKSKKDAIGAKIVDGAYGTMIDRLKSTKNPNFFLLNYSLQNFSVLNFFVIPKHFFVPEIIEKRKPLANTARRAGWVGCNILLSTIPQSGKIFLIKNGIIETKERVAISWNKTLFLREEKDSASKGWLLDIMTCVESFGMNEFSLMEMYSFESILKRKHQDNNHIKEKIRQQLQILRDKHYLEFIDRGQYRIRNIA